jgi:ABC-type taurine transport system substrate-binding protein
MNNPSYVQIIDRVFTEYFPQVIDTYLPESKTNKDKRFLNTLIESKSDYILQEYKFKRFHEIVDKISKYSGVDKKTVINDYNEIKDDTNLFKNRLKYELITYIIKKY